MEPSRSFGPLKNSCRRYMGILIGNYEITSRASDLSVGFSQLLGTSLSFAKNISLDAFEFSVPRPYSQLQIPEIEDFLFNNLLQAIIRVSEQTSYYGVTIGVCSGPLRTSMRAHGRLRSALAADTQQTRSLSKGMKALQKNLLSHIYQLATMFCIIRSIFWRSRGYRAGLKRFTNAR